MGKIDSPGRIDSTHKSNTGIFDSVVVEYILYYWQIVTLAVVKLVWLAYVCSQKSYPSLQSAQCQLPIGFTNELRCLFN